MPVALDTNILVYAEGVDGATRQAEALGIIAALEAEDIVLPVQVLGELFHVLTRKARLPAAEAEAKVASWGESYRAMPTTEPILRMAMGLAARHRLAIWDAVVIVTAAEARCAVLLTEDMQHGFTWRGVTIRNPFAAGD